MKELSQYETQAIGGGKVDGWQIVIPGSIATGLALAITCTIGRKEEVASYFFGTLFRNMGMALFGLTAVVGAVEVGETINNAVNHSKTTV